eukprot:TRINITY_DN70890_c0_g1_i1.p1 TRINITY_DN70890_c0_g1~~TRINITY_DN70890_c0_g1_i1.p1  ORF type:complete len:218 (+),score=19.77 TRINITY_DN70890_c0_g1_i1:116-769(+)
MSVVATMRSSRIFCRSIAVATACAEASFGWGIPQPAPGTDRLSFFPNLHSQEHTEHSFFDNSGNETVCLQSSKLGVAVHTQEMDMFSYAQRFSNETLALAPACKQFRAFPGVPGRWDSELIGSSFASSGLRSTLASSSHGTALEALHSMDTPSIQSRAAVLDLLNSRSQQIHCTTGDLEGSCVGTARCPDRAVERVRKQLRPVTFSFRKGSEGRILS